MFRGRRTYDRLARRFRSASSEWFLQTVLDHRLLSTNVPSIKLPEAFELAKVDGWCLLACGHGMLCVVECPLNLRDDKTGEVVGEVAVLEAREPTCASLVELPCLAKYMSHTGETPTAPRTDLWGLVVFKRDGEPLEEFGLRVRKAMILRRPGDG